MRWIRDIGAAFVQIDTDAHLHRAQRARPTPRIQAAPRPGPRDD
jgi:hypothetical protein